jgi:hypothetical protein
MLHDRATVIRSIIAALALIALSIVVLSGSARHDTRSAAVYRPLPQALNLAQAHHAVARLDVPARQP